MVYSARDFTKKKKKSKKILVFIAIIVLIMLLAWWFVFNKKAQAPEYSNGDNNQSSTEEQQPYQSINIQAAVDDWEAKYPANYSLVVYDLQSNETIAEKNKDDKLFAASLYKIFVAYLSLLDFQTGAQNPDDILIAGQTKRQCVDKMIRSSDSPCGEAMMADMGQTTLNERVIDMGMKGTTFNGIQTTAADSALILRYINEGRDLNKENTDFLLDAMLTQDAKFKRGLQTGAPDAKWQTKVGWNEDVNYHDIGIMTLPDGRKFAVAILGQGSGSPEPIADFASTIYTALTAQ